MHHSYIRWFEIAPLIVFIGGWFTVGALAASLAITVLALLQGSAPRARLAVLAVFFVAEIVLLSYVYPRTNTPGWFEPFLLFNGYALPLQVLVALGVQFGRGWRARWATVGALVSLALPVVGLLSWWSA